MPAPPQSSPPEAPNPYIHFDSEEWLPYMEDEQTSDAYKREIIAIYWSIALAFVDFHWETEQFTPKPLPSTDDTRGQFPDLAAELHAAVVNCEDTENIKEEI